MVIELLFFACYVKQNKTKQNKTNIFRNANRNSQGGDLKKDHFLTWILTCFSTFKQ